MIGNGAVPKTVIRPQTAKAEQARRELARRRFLDFCRYVDERFLALPHARLLAEKLEQVARYIETGGQEGIGRLMILMPPRHGKTEQASIKFPAWLLGKVPDVRVILTSYSAELASRNSRQMRDLVLSNAYQAVFGSRSSSDAPVLLSADSRAVSTWDLAQPHRGGVVAAGVGGSITGMGATLLVVDDPLKGREEAESDKRRETVDEWYRSVAYNRLDAHGAVIVFHTRWHPDDLAGKLIRRMAMDEKADQFEIVFLPAVALDAYPVDAEQQRQYMLDGIYLPLADPLNRAAGEALWTSRFNAEWLDKKKSNIGEYEFESQYQQNPYSRAGGFLKREWLNIVEAGPGREAVARIRYWDKAASKSGDYTAGVLMSVDRDGIYTIEHVARAKLSAGERDAMMARIGVEDYLQYGAFPIYHQQDPGSAGVDSAEATNDVMADAGLRALFEPVSGEKIVRASTLASKAQSNKVRLVAGAWNDAFLDEAVAFPNGRNDDQIDAAASAINKLRDWVRNPYIEDDVIIYEERVDISPF